ncbi:protein kinase domain-containing protein [Sorangium sp. So ce1097]|uniref:serine/threonine-protein kinase n=1 Tax=Sorangium sp. So ce1097 TaxID=3133330 RepID=UPI003F62CBDB
MYDDDAEHWVGKTFAGMWRIERVLGTGGMGSVLLGRAADGSQVALKVLHPELNAITEVRKRFLREGFIGNTLGGADPVPGVVRVLGSGETPEGLAYLTMEALQGETIFDRMARTGTMPPGEVLALADQVLETLAIAHARGVVHRDLKPENIHLGSDGRVRMLDFGIARVVDGLTGLPEKTATKTGMIMGTATYMAPEQATGLIHDIDGRTDLFGLGATMFRLLSGRQVHGDVTEAMEVIAAATEPAPALASVAPGVPHAVAAVVDRSLAFIKFHRYPNAETMRADVRAVLAGALPPYAQAVLDGRIRAGQPLSQPPLPLAPGAVSPSARPQPTVTEPPPVPGAMTGRPERTLDDSLAAPSAVGAPRAQLSTGKLVLLVGGASLATGVLVAVAVVLLFVNC